MERANLILGEVWRAVKHATETRVGGRLETDHLLICWMGRHCCWIFSLYHVRPDGRAAFEALRKSSYRSGLACFESLGACTWIETAAWLV